MLSLLTFPDPRLRNKALRVDPQDPENSVIVKNLHNEMQRYQAYGMNAPMFGISKAIVVLNQDPSLNQENQEIPEVLFNPTIITGSLKTQTIEEGSPCFGNIRAEITRSVAIIVRYNDMQGKICEIEVEGFMATVLQHQLDHLGGRNFLDHLSLLKRKLLLKKIAQNTKHMQTHHVHGPNCHHD